MFLNSCNKSSTELIFVVEIWSDFKRLLLLLLSFLYEVSLPSSDSPCVFNSAIAPAVVVSRVFNFWSKDLLRDWNIKYEPPHGKTNNLHRRKQRRRSASR